APPGPLTKEARAEGVWGLGRGPRSRLSRWGCAMPVRSFLPRKSFDPETLAVLNAAFAGVCADLGVSEKARHSRETVAKKVLELADGQRDAAAIRAAVVASLSGTHPTSSSSRRLPPTPPPPPAPRP